MRALLLCCLVALAVCQESYDLSLNPNKIYEYQYEGKVRFGLEKPNRAETGARMKSLVKIIGVSSSSPDTFLLQFSSVVFEEFNGYSRNSDYVAVEALAEKIKDQLSKPITFRYTNGNVVSIDASPEMSDTVVNIVRGFLGFFQVTIKTTQEIYELEEVGIHGKCLSSYTIKTTDREQVMDLTQVVDVTNCREKAAFYSGLANAVEDKDAKKRGESMVSTVKYTYDIKGGRSGIITKAQALELQFITPFNVKEGTFQMEAKKELVLIAEKDKPQDLHIQLQGQLVHRGNLMYKVEKNNANIPIVMQKVDDPKAKASELIKRLAQRNAQQIDSTTTHEAIKLYQLLRLIPQEQLMQLWEELKANTEERRWFLHTVVEVNDDRILHFLEQYLQEPHSTIEAVTVIVQAFNHLEASANLVEKAKKFLIKEYSNHMIRKTAVLSYGSLVFKYCSYHTPCPEQAIRPLLDMADRLQSNTHEEEEEKILILKALGNAGHPSSLKTITRFLPGVDPNPDKIDKRPRVVSAAVQAMRLITIRDPHNVQLNTLKLFLNRELESELRMLALMIMFDTKPSIALVSTVTAHLLEERDDMQVVNFAYTYLKSLARATTPDKHSVSIAASVAVKILAPRFGHLGYYTSRGMRMDVFSGDYLMGSAVEAFILKRASQLIPAEMMVKSNFHFIGRILQLVEFGIRPEGIRDLFANHIPGLRGDLSMSDFQAVHEVLKKWETLPEDKPILSFYTRVSGQEFFFKDLHTETLKTLMRNLSQVIGRDNLLWSLIESLIQGFSWRGILPFLTAEARYVQATTLGLPMEISKYYHVVSGLRIDAKAGMNSNTNEHLRELLKSEISLKTNGYIGYNKNMWLFYGINTNLFQSAVEIEAKNPVHIPFNVNAKVNYNTKKFEVEVARTNREIELFSFTSNAYAVSRNIIHPEAAKKVQIVSDEHSQIQKYSHVMINQPNRWEQVKKNCVTSQVYGLSICTEMDLKREYYQNEYPLYYFLGLTHLAVKLEPVQGSSVERIRLEINIDPTSQTVSVRQLIDGLRQVAKEIRQSRQQSRNSASEEQQDRPTRGIGGSPVPKVQIKVLAEGSSRQQGYDTVLFYTLEGQSYSAQMITSYIGDSSSNWKLCVDAAEYGEAKANIGWGEECKTYTMTMRTAFVATNKPQVKAYFSWRRMPEYIEEYGRRVARYIPGMAYLMGFNQVHEANTSQEVSASIIAVSADSIDVKIKLPELTLYRESLTSPMPPAYILEDSTINSNTQ